MSLLSSLQLILPFPSYCHTRLTLIGIFLCMCFLTGCTTPVTVDYDREAASKFYDYECFVVDSLEVQKGLDDIVFSPIAIRRFTRALGTALIKRGYVKNCPEPDFRVLFRATKKQITRMNSTYPYTAMNFRYHAYYPDFGFFPSPYIDQYDEGTFLIDIVDAHSQDLVWRGSYAERLDRRPHSNEEIRFIINKILDQFPPMK